ncbi:VWA domain-containing protein [Deinococcus sonorensis]|uniref:VWA domain-containing protein n=2 Tax=Deinococcus sonorensis TaxID=309891 RepID=A0AAU7U9X8_9DEIO
MSFLWPWALLALLAVPLLVWVYRRGLGGPAHSAALHPDLRLLAQASRQPRSLRRHLPAGLYLAALALGLIALARPTAPLPLPDNRTTIMLSLDVSQSMDADDIAPNRIQAAQEAARRFVRSLPDGARVGLASFAGYAVLNTPPTTEHQRVLDAIDQLNLGRGTAIGAGLLTALQALPERGPSQTGTSTAPAGGKRPPAAIVLLSDGRNNRGIDPLQAAAQARDLDVKVYTVGLGTEGGQMTLGGYRGFNAGFDAETLTGIATTTHGKYYAAGSAGQLNSIYRSLGRSLGWTVQPREVSGFVAALAGLLLLASLASSELYTRRML